MSVLCRVEVVSRAPDVLAPEVEAVMYPGSRTRSRRQRLALMMALALSAGPAAADAPLSPSFQADPGAHVIALREAGRFGDALRATQDWQAREPDSADAWKLEALTLADMGAAQLAWERLHQRPDAFARHEREKIEGDRMAHRIRWGTAYPRDDAKRLDEMRNALALIRQMQDRDPRETNWETTRLRIDALSALNHLQRHEEVVSEYTALQRDGVELPAWVLPVIGDSLLALRRPQEAATVLQQARAANPDDVNTRILLAYAWIEQERFDLAVPMLEALVEEQPAWPRREGALRGYENWDRYSADITLAMVRSAAQDNAAAERALRARVAIGPADPGLQSALAVIEARRQRPSSALQRQAIALTLDPRQHDAALGQVDSLLALQRPDAAADVLDTLRRDRPEDLRLARAQRTVDLQRGWQIDLEAGRGRSNARDGGTSVSPLGSRDGLVHLSARSPLINDRWRVGLDARDDWARLDGDHVRYRGIGATAEYRYDRLGAALGIMRSIDDFDRATTVALDVDWRLSDAWQVSAAARRNDPEASLQARRLGITADSITLGASHTPSDTTAVDLQLSHFRYDDGNRRDQVGVDARQRLSSRPHLLVDGLASVSTSCGSAGADAGYFNPDRDASATVGLRIEHISWRRYEREFRQRLEVGAGPYWQRGAGTSWVPTLGLRHLWTPVQGQRLEYGVSWARPVYDGRRESRIMLDMAWRWGGGQ